MKTRMTAILVMVLAWATGARSAEEQVALFPILQNGKWGYMDGSGKVAIAPQFDNAWDFSEGLARVQVGVQRGYIDKTGKIVIKPEYAMARPFSEGLAAVYVGAGKFGEAVDMRGGGRWVFIDKTGKFVVDPRTRLEFVDDFHDGEARVKFTFNGHMRTSFVSTNGTVRQFVNKPVVSFSEGLAACPSNRGYGFIDHTGKFVIPDEFADGGQFSEGLAPAAVLLDVNDPARTPRWTKAAKYNLALRNAPDKTWGTNSIPMNDGESVGLGATKTFTFEVVAPAKEGKYNFQWQMQGPRGFGDTTSNAVVTVVGATNLPAITAQPRNAAVAVGATATFTVAATGATPVSYQWKKNGADIAGATGESHTTPAVTKEDNEARFSVVVGNAGGSTPSVEALLSVAPEAAPAQADKPKTPGRPENGARFVSMSVPTIMTTGQVCAVSVTMRNTGPKAPKWAYIDKTGKIAIEPEYEAARAFSEGLASVLTGGKWGCVDKTGKMIVNAQYDFVAPFSEGLARTVVGGKHGYIDKTGKTVIEPKFDVGWEFSKGLARVEIDLQQGYIDKTGKYVWEPKERLPGFAVRSR